MRGARAGRELSLHRLGHGAGAGAGAAGRRRVADRLRLALELRGAGDRRALRHRHRLAAAAGDLAAARAEAGFARRDAASPTASWRAIPRFLAYLGLGTASYAGLFAWISGASFVLQDLYGLSPFAFGVAFALGSVGYMTGATLAARMVVRSGIDATIGFGALAIALGGLAMVAAVALGLRSAVSLVLPMAIYLAGLGMVLPQAMPAR